MTVDHAAAIRSLEDRLTILQRARIRAEHERDQAEATATKLRAALHDEFGVDTVEAAHAMRADLENQLQSQIDALTTALDELGA